MIRHALRKHHRDTASFIVSALFSMCLVLVSSHAARCASPTVSGLPTSVTVLAGAPLHIPLDGFDADGDPITFSADSNDSLLTAEIVPDNRSLVFDVDSFGEITVEVFESRMPELTERVINLATLGIYDGTLFHRVIDDFVIQGGDPTGTGSGGTGTYVEDEFHPDLQYTSGGLMGMAHAAFDDAIDSQFFLTEVPLRYLDFDYPIVGLITEGDSVREAISEVPVAGTQPLADVVLNSVSVINDTENGVLTLAAPHNTTGTAEVVVTADDGMGGISQYTIDVDVVLDGTNTPPYLLDLPETFSTTVDTPLTVSLEGFDVEQDALYYEAVIPGTHPDLSITVDHGTGEVEITPTNGFLGDFDVQVGVRQQVSPLTFDTETFTVSVQVPEPSSVVLLAVSLAACLTGYRRR